LDGETYISQSKANTHEKQTELVKDMLRVYHPAKLVNFIGHHYHATFGQKVGLQYIKTDVASSEN
jgi:hypothetical protein